MTGDKMLEILRAFELQEIPLRGTHISCTGGGEIELSFNSQLPYDATRYLKRKGFVQGGNPADAYSFVYRPR